MNIFLALWFQECYIQVTCVTANEISSIKKSSSIYNTFLQKIPICIPFNQMTCISRAKLEAKLITPLQQRSTATCSKIPIVYPPSPPTLPKFLVYTP